ncbi:MAG: hypothetical protein ACYDCO_27615 [Armatimonadota bacterium]
MQSDAARQQSHTNVLLAIMLTLLLVIAIGLAVYFVWWSQARANQPAPQEQQQPGQPGPAGPEGEPGTPAPSEPTNPGGGSGMRWEPGTDWVVIYT